jgi:hypothetical protein
MNVDFSTLLKTSKELGKIGPNQVSTLDLTAMRKNRRTWMIAGLKDQYVAQCLTTNKRPTIRRGKSTATTETSYFLAEFFIILMLLILSILLYSIDI